MYSLADNLSWAMIVCAFLAACFILMRRSYGHFGRRVRDDSPLVHVPRSTFETPNHASVGADWVARAEIELHEKTRDVLGKLDSKISALEYLTGTAEQQIQQLQALIKQAEVMTHNQADGSSARAPPHG
jgi:hypothetical protein